MTSAADGALPAVSLVIVSRQRPDALRRLLSALQFQAHPRFELIVVSDQPRLEDVALADQIRHRQFDQPNISAARNIGLRMARGDVVAFCDDDAVPDPWWLSRLTAPFADDRVGLAGGYVRGRNGISLQWAATQVDLNGDDHPLPVAGDDPVVTASDAGLFPRAHGTNCAFRASALRDIGGFDEGFRFFLDETDVCLRLGQAGWSTAIVPLAQVHHGFAGSAQRTANRVPRSLYDIGASKALFLAKHGGKGGQTLAALRGDRRVQLLGLMRDGRIEPRDVPRLMATLEDGLAARVEPQVAAAVAAESDAPLRPVATLQPDQAVPLVCTPRSLKSAINAAQKLRETGKVPFILNFSFTALFHKRTYDQRGFWIQSGGLFGKADRRQSLLRFTTLGQRAIQERTAFGKVFCFGPVELVKKNHNLV